MKDPHNTVERLTNALECLVTVLGDEERLVAACNALLPLQSADFPDPAAQELFERIVALPSVDGPIPPKTVKEGATWVWDLYWMMSANTRYK
ncbi:hypothetical protein N5J43_08210 [Pseudomonas nicosulfuronedens]|uniref:hypothetical protein n=1 Tax=Pseudomonas nicosulfuronedens TaxID=2571105 RepID=UPI00244D4138|nr:hypothetical protein [Pseudomonas nicosulfuronedens]MDH1009956.1 hypothetical protein [Pseudomonas nicosulfuronedens]MDH1978932.1 hypothetical protein [Pseudomonas nicosulfuronedens]MDH2028389.1 hypothetical protein [Pseudomonas nicosulfuronedens]